MRTRASWLLATTASLAAFTIHDVHAAPACRVMDIDVHPEESPNADPGLRRALQIVAWLEKPDGTYVETVYITRDTGSYGLGNRPGRFDFNSAPTWPYGRRTTVFPVWAHRHGLTFPEVVFQDGAENNLSHSPTFCSGDTHYCAPRLRQPGWDAVSCASVAYTDKGTLGSGESLYPPRVDVIKKPDIDSNDVLQYPTLNPFDAVSKASPKSGDAATLSWTMPDDFPAGDYVLWLEVSREFDQNATYSATRYPGPMVAYGDYGAPYRGQPSIVYKLPITVGTTAFTATTSDWFGYGDPDGIDGSVRPPDDTITVDTPGSGAQRLGFVPGTTSRVRVNAGPEGDTQAPGGLRQFDATYTSRSATLSFVAPGDDQLSGTVTAYEIRYLVGADLTRDNFATAIVARPTFDIVNAGQVQEIELDKLLPETTYSVGVRAIDNCGNAGPLAIAKFTTPERAQGDVDACFIATAAYGSVMAADVEQLRHFRDTALSHSVLGQLAVTTYYTFSPPVAGVIGESELLRATVRDVLAPVVHAVRTYVF